MIANMMSVRVMVAIVVVSAICWSVDSRPEATTRLPSSWRRTSCVSAPKVVSAKNACKPKDSVVDHDEIRICMLTNMKIQAADNSLDIDVTKKIIDEFTHTTDAQKKSLKNMIDNCMKLARYESVETDSRKHKCIYEKITKTCVDKEGDLKPATAA